LKEIETIANESIEDENRTLNQYEAANIRLLRDQFRTVLIAELGTFTAFLVTVKEAYDLNALIVSPASLFPSSLLLKVPDSIRDVAEVGRALAFEVPTGCGFHVFRVVEAVLRRYTKTL